MIRRVVIGSAHAPGQFVGGLDGFGAVTIELRSHHQMLRQLVGGHDAVERIVQSAVRAQGVVSNVAVDAETIERLTHREPHTFVVDACAQSAYFIGSWRF